MALLSMSLILMSGDHVFAHVSQQGIVLLLPTGTYISSGCLAVIFSMIIVTILPHHLVFKIFCTKELKLKVIEPLVRSEHLASTASMVSLTVVICLILLGLAGSRDPLTNLMPLAIWTFFWIFLYMMHCVVGNIWAWINPWTGAWKLLTGDLKGIFRLPAQLGKWPAVFLFFLFYLFIIVDLAPDDPARLSIVVFSYLCFNFLGMALFGRRPWMRNVECFSVLFTLLSRLAPIQYDRVVRSWRLGLPGWRAIAGNGSSISQSFFLLTILACGSFDGVNETFWWLAQIGINPLAFPGRSAVVIESTAGLLIALMLVCAAFALTICLSCRLVTPTNGRARGKISYINIFNTITVTALPITAVYHGSHYYISFLVNSQYLAAALSDPLANGNNLLGLTDYQVTTGYLADIASVRRIWLTQAGLVVCGHILAVLMAHYLIARHFSARKDAIAFHVPVAIFMAAYTWFGLWLLAAPKGA